MNECYEILNSTKFDSIEDIKKTYRKLQFKYHPDKGGNKKKFIKINKAYDIIIKNHKEQENNNILKNNLKNVKNCENMNKNSKEKNINLENCMNKPKTIIKIINITMEDSYFGKKYPIEIDRWYVENNEKYNEKEKIYIDLYKGIDENEIIILKNKGHILNKNNKGDIKIIIKIKNNTFFERNGLDLIYEKKVNLKDALIGVSFNIKHLSGKIYEIKSNDFNKKKKLKNMGFKRDDFIGDLIIKFNIIIPTELTKYQIQKINEIL